MCLLTVFTFEVCWSCCRFTWASCDIIIEATWLSNSVFVPGALPSAIVWVKASAIDLKIVGTISRIPSPRHSKQHWTYLNESFSARSSILKNLTLCWTIEIHLQSCLKSSRKVSKHLPLITIQLCSCSEISDPKNCFSPNSISLDTDFVCRARFKIEM